MRYLLPIVLFLFTQNLTFAQFSTIAGTVDLDLDSNCMQTFGDQTMYDIVVEARDTFTNEKYYGITSYLQGGFYRVENLPPSTYSLNITLPYDHPYATACQSNIIRTISGGVSDTVVFSVSPNSFTPLMKVDLSSDGLPDCGIAHYKMRYANMGTDAANNVEIELELDSSLQLISASEAFTAGANPNTYLFSVGTVLAGRDTSGLIDLQIDINCATTIPGQTHQAKATIRPDPISSYNGPLLQTKAECLGSSIQFRTANIGSSSATTTTALIVIEDDVMYSQPVVGPLDTIFEDTITLPALPGRSYYLQAAQYTGIPKIVADPIAWAGLEGCRDNGGSFNTTSLLQYYTENAVPHIAYDLQNAGDTLNYNIMRSQLKGYGVNRYIDQNVPIEYQLRFQNNSMSTIVGVQIRDTLPEELNPNSLQLNVSSDNYFDLRIEAGRVLVIDMPFQDLNPGEQGFVNFTLDQELDNLIGTIIENSASIILGGTDTIQTPTIFHTIGANYISILSQEILSVNHWEIMVYPNPMRDYANFELKGGDFETVLFELYTMQGQLLKRIQTQDPLFQLDRGELNAGYYAYRLIVDGQAVNTGKLLVQ